MSDAIPVNGEVLRWARESAGQTIDEVVQKMNRKRITYEMLSRGSKVLKHQHILNLND